MRAIDVPSHQAADLAALSDLLDDMRSGWRSRAACKRPGVNPEWFAPKGGRQVPIEARRVCAGCPVVADCARFGADQTDPAFPMGTVWAGEYPNQLAAWRDAETPEWAALMAGRTRVTDGMKRRSRSDAAA